MPIDRHVVDVGLGPRPIDHRFVVAGDEAGILPKPRDSQRQEMLLEKGPCPGAIGDIESFGGTAGFTQRRAERLGVGGRLSLFGNWLAACAKGLVRLQMIVRTPAGDIAPRNRRILAAADLKRPLESRIGNGAGDRRMRACTVRGGEYVRL